jgi:hypothetical protein
VGWHGPEQRDYEMTRTSTKWNIVVLLLAIAVLAFAVVASYREFFGKGALCTAAGALLVLVLFGRLTQSSVRHKRFARTRRPLWRAEGGSERGNPPFDTLFSTSNVFMSLAAVFLLAFPYSEFLQAVGLMPGLAFTAVLVFLLRHTQGESSIPGLIGILIWLLAFWLWGEAGRQGFAVMPVDVPSGAEASLKENIFVSTKLLAPMAEREPMPSKLEFTGDGMANALETTIAGFGGGELGNYGQSEAAQILAGPELITRLFPTHPWYKGTSLHSPQLTGLETSHVIFNTQIHDLPLSSIYHLLRHIRGKPTIEGQILIGDNSLTLALRRSNYELSCTSTDLSQALKAKIASKAGNTTVDDILSFIQADQAQAKLPDGSNCERWSLTRVLSWLDLLPSPRNGQEERIANVSVTNPIGDSQLTELLDFAVLDAMGKLSSERLAYYYDNAAKYESALKEYEEALPGLLSEYRDTPQWVRHAITDRVVEVLTRIGDLESELNEKEDLSEGAYKLAEDILHNNVRVLSRVGYHYLILSQLAMLRADAQQKHCQTGDKREGKAQAECLRETQMLKETARRWAGRAERNLLSASKYLDAAFYQYSGVDHGRDTLAWLYANYGYVLAREGKQSGDIDQQVERALYYGSTLSRDWQYPPVKQKKVFEEIGNRRKQLLSENEDLRVAAAAAYGWFTGPLGAAAQSGPSYPTPADMTSQIDGLLKGTDQYTVNNMILIESQLRDFYAQIVTDYNEAKGGKQGGRNENDAEKENSSEEAQSCDTASPGTKRDLHESSLYLLAALREYRAGQFDEAFYLIHVLKSKCDRLRRLQDFATAFILSTWQVYAPNDDRKAHILAAQGAFNAILGKDEAEQKKKEKDELFWRALSLRAVREAMCLDSPNRMLCVPEKMPDLQAAASAASREMPGNAYLHANLGIVSVRTDKPDLSSNHPSTALKEFQQAVEINQWDPWLRCLLAEAYEENGETEESQNQLQFGRLLDPSRWNYYYNDVHSVWPTLVYRAPPKGKHGVDPKDGG